ncbi:MAG: hypothetical protein KBD25_01485 [Rickettsiaceae bacterium]|nr:hypothetical protein [Rickettsiaceae bacterium]
MHYQEEIQHLLPTLAEAEDNLHTLQNYFLVFSQVHQDPIFMEKQISALKNGIDNIFKMLDMTPLEAHQKYHEMLKKIDFSGLENDGCQNSELPVTISSIF